MKEILNNTLANWWQSVKNYLKRLLDVRVLGLHVFVLIALLVTWSGLGVIQRNYKLQQELSRLQQEVQVLELQNNSLRLRNEFFNTDQYQELIARQQFGKAAKGEKLVLVPEEVALKNTVEQPSEEQTSLESNVQKPKYQENFEAWMEFLFRRSG
jgi:cell division protein FtsB